jgi:hypothetical protein
MILGALGIGIIGLLIGIMIERYKWVRSVKLNKVIEVDGDLYNVSKVKVTACRECSAFGTTACNDRCRFFGRAPDGSPLCRHFPTNIPVNFIS